MKITDITATWLQVPIPPERQHVSDYGPTHSIDTVLVKVGTDGGVTGYGEARGSVSINGNCAAVCAAVENEFAPLLRGEDPRDITRLWDTMYNATRTHFALDRGHAFRRWAGGAQTSRRCPASTSRSGTSPASRSARRSGSCWAGGGMRRCCATPPAAGPPPTGSASS